MAMQWTALANKIKLNSLPVPKKHCFLSLCSFVFSIFYNFLFRFELHTDFMSFHFKFRNQTEGLEPECWGCEVSALTLLEGPNKVPYRNLFTSHFPLFTSTKNSVIPAANHSLDPLHMHTGICILIGLLCFQFLGTLVQ